MYLDFLEHYVLITKKRPSSSQQEAGIQKSFRAFFLNKTGTDFSFPSSTESNDQHPECRSKGSITSSRSSLVHIASSRLVKISK